MSREEWEEQAEMDVAAGAKTQHGGPPAGPRGEGHLGLRLLLEKGQCGQAWLHQLTSGWVPWQA